MCTWSRPHTFSQTIKMLEEQTHKDFELVVWNNNPSIKEELNATLSNSNISGKITTWKDNIGGIGRFYASREVDTPYVIFIDDDQVFEPSMIEQLVAQASLDTISGWWSWNFEKGYHIRRRTLPGNDADYIGTGGMICPSHIFKNNKLFQDLPTQFLFIEDLWLVRFFKKHYNGKLIAAPIRMQFMPGEDKRNQHHNLTDLKTEFYNWLVTNGY